MMDPGAIPTFKTCCCGAPMEPAHLPPPHNAAGPVWACTLRPRCPENVTTTSMLVLDPPWLAEIHATHLEGRPAVDLCMFCNKPREALPGVPSHACRTPECSAYQARDPLEPGAGGTRSVLCKRCRGILGMEDLWQGRHPSCLAADQADGKITDPSEDKRMAIEEAIAAIIFDFEYPDDRRPDEETCMAIGRAIVASFPAEAEGGAS